MAGLFGLSVDEEYRGNFPKELFIGTLYGQHLGKAYAGLAVTNSEKEINIQTHKGSVRETFEGEVAEFEGHAGIGYSGLSREPFLVDSKIGQICTCFSGNIINRHELISYFLKLGHTFGREGDDIEIITKLIAQKKNVAEGIKWADAKIKGAFSLLVLTSEGIYAALSSAGQWSLVLGQKKGAIVVASESIGFGNLEIKLLRSVEPGEVVLLSKGECRTITHFSRRKIKNCSFYSVYTSFPNNISHGVPDSLVRKGLGAAHARKDIFNGFIPDRISLIPDSGRYHAIGYKEEFDRQVRLGIIPREKIPIYDEVLLKYTAATGRSFILSEKEQREFEAIIKILSSSEDYTGQIIVICDDSLVRGTQTRSRLVPKLKYLGFSEIHFRFSFPYLFSYCPYGKTTKRGELLAPLCHSDEEIARFLEVDSVRFNSTGDVVEANHIPRKNLCFDCASRVGS